MAPIVVCVRIEIWSDVVCPWCYIGKRRFENALAALETMSVTEPIEVVYRSYQLDPSAPEGRTTPVVDAYAKKFGGPARAEAILSHVTGVAKGENLNFRMDLALRANTTNAHRVLHRVLAVHGHGAQASCKEAMLDAYFCRGLDVSDPDVLVRLCTDAVPDLDGAALRDWLDGPGGHDDVRRDIADAASREITGVPAYVIDDRFIIPGAQDTELFLRVITKMLAT